MSGRKRRRVSPTTVKSESCTHSRQRHFDEQRRENIRTLRRRVEHTHRHYIANAHYLHNNPQPVSRHRESSNVTSMVDETQRSLIISCVKLWQIEIKVYPNRFYPVIVVTSLCKSLWMYCKCNFKGCLGFSFILG